MDIKDLDITKRILVEDRALKAMMQCVEAERPPTEEALDLVRQVRANKTTDDTEGRLVDWSTAVILGLCFEPQRAPAVVPSQEGDARYFEYVAQAWSCWAAGDLVAAEELLKRLEGDEKAKLPGGEMHMMALSPWRDAVAALIRDDQNEARRLYRRSMEAGSQLGTETSTAVQWTYAASFLTHV